MQDVIEQQHLFSLYVHLPPNKTLEGPPTIFNGHEIPNSIVTGESQAAALCAGWQPVAQQPRSTLHVALACLP